MAEEDGPSTTPYGLFQQEDVEEAYQEVLSVKVASRGRSGGVTFKHKVGDAAKINYKAVTTEHLCHAMVATKVWDPPLSSAAGAPSEGAAAAKEQLVVKGSFPPAQYTLMQELLRRVRAREVVGSTDSSDRTGSTKQRRTNSPKRTSFSWYTASSGSGDLHPDSEGR